MNRWRRIANSNGQPTLQESRNDDAEKRLELHDANSISQISPSKSLKKWDSHEKKIVPELQAPITAEVERQLKQLVAQFGAKQVLKALDPLVTTCKWNDWQMRGECLF
jgi:hypothetical protein